MPIDDATLSKSKRKPRTTEELSHLASKNGSLFYELAMMLEAEKLWNRAKQQRDSTYNMAIECFLLHFRNLRDFLYPSPGAWTNQFYFDDVIANDFWSEWRSVYEDWTECSADEKSRIDKLLAHLSYSRPSLDHAWPIPKMSTAIQNALAEFLTSLPDERKEWFTAIKIDRP